jgi:dGTP triphosphohydrolase
MFREVYLSLSNSDEAEVAREIVHLLYHHLASHPHELPAICSAHGETPQWSVVDYLAGMTDPYTIRLVERLQSGVS